MTHAKKTQCAPEANEATALPAPAKSPPKFAVVITLLKREEGATLAERVEATGWQPHITRAMPTGLRKKRHAIERRKRNEVTCYHLPFGDA